MNDKTEISNIKTEKQDQPQEPMSDLVKAHLDEIAGGIRAHSSWYSEA